MLIISFVFGTIAFNLYRTQQNLLIEKNNAPNPKEKDSNDVVLTYTVPLAVVVSQQLSSLVEPQSKAGAKFLNEIPRLRSAIYYDIGVLLPVVHVSSDSPLLDYQYFIAVKEVPVVHGSIKPNSVLVNDSAENIKAFGLKGEDVLNPANLKPGAWIPSEQRAKAEAVGLKIWEPEDFILLHLSRVMKRYAHEFVGIQEAQTYLEHAARGMPKLVEEVVPKTISIQKFTEVLQRLVQENISIRDTKSILEALSEWAHVENNTVLLTEYIRASLKRYISFRYAKGRNTLNVYLLDPEIEDLIRSAIRRTSNGSFLALDPTLAHDILNALRREIGRNLTLGYQDPVVVTEMELRRFIHKLVELEFPNLAVLSYQELTPELNVQPIGRITLRSNQSSLLPEETLEEISSL
jgi:type III secretion protein V